MSMMNNCPGGLPSPPGPVEVVCFGMLCYCHLLVVDAPLVRNGGTRIKQSVESFGDDAAIVASLLAQWEVPAGFISTALGDDESGRRLAQRLRATGMHGEFRFSKRFSTDLEVSIVDPGGARTYLQERNPEVLATLAHADLAMLDDAKFLYIDWYDGDYILGAMRRAHNLGLTVYLNIESRYNDLALLGRLAPYATVCQVSTDEPGDQEAPDRIIDLLLESGIHTVVITGGRRNCLVVNTAERVSVKPPRLSVVDGYGAGAAFSAAFILGSLRGWALEKRTRFAIAAASLKCSVAGNVAFPIPEIEALADRL